MRRRKCWEALVLVWALIVSAVLAVPPAVAQPAARPCAAEQAQEDGFQSRGMGLTAGELETLYGPSQIGQGSNFFDFGGGHLHKLNCDLILSFPRDGSAEPVDEVTLAESLLPADTELIGTITFGTPISSNEMNTFWRSPSLAARFAALGEDRGGEILIVYTYEPLGPAIYQIELRTFTPAG